MYGKKKITFDKCNDDGDNDNDDKDDKVVCYSPSPKNKVKVLAANFFDEICRRPGTEKTLARQPFQHIN